MLGSHTGQTGSGLGVRARVSRHGRDPLEQGRDPLWTSEDWSKTKGEAYGAPRDGEAHEGCGVGPGPTP